VKLVGFLHVPDISNASVQDLDVLRDDYAAHEPIKHFSSHRRPAR
jgi:hypothetical protein